MTPRSTARTPTIARPSVPPRSVPPRSVPLAAAVALAAAAAAAHATAAEVVSRTSPGGIEFLHAPLARADAVSVEIAWPSVWAYTEGAVAAPFVGADLVLSGGVGDLDPAGLRDALDELGVERAVSVRPDHVHAAFELAPERLDEAFDLVARALAEPALDARRFRTVRDDFEASVVEAKGAIGTFVHDALVRLVLGDGPLGRSLSMEPASLAGDVTPEDVRRWHADTFARRGATVAVAGPVDAAAAGEAIDRLFDRLPAGDVPGPVPAPDADFSARTVLLHAPEADTGAVALFGPLPSTADGGEIEDLLAAFALDEREGVSAILVPWTRELRALLLYAEGEPERLDRARRALPEAYAAFVARGPDADEIESGRDRLAGGLGRTLASPSGLARTALESALDGREPERVRSMLDVEVGGTSERGVAERLRTAWPAVEEMIEIVVSPDAGAVEGACTVGSLDELEGC